MIKKRKPITKAQMAMRKISCDRCGRKHFVSHGDWVITASKKVLCCDSTLDSCFMKNMRGE